MSNHRFVVEARTIGGADVPVSTWMSESEAHKEAHHLAHGIVIAGVGRCDHPNIDAIEHRVGGSIIHVRVTDTESKTCSRSMVASTFNEREAIADAIWREVMA